MGDGFAFFDIIIFAMLAGYLIFQLRRVLGRRDGHEQRRADPFKRDQANQDQPNHDQANHGHEEESQNDNVIALDDRAPDRAADHTAEPPEDMADMDGLTRLKTLDETFDDVEFLGGAKSAFEWIVSAFAKGDRAGLANLLSEPLMRDFEAAINAREEAGEQAETLIASIKSAQINGVSFDGSVATVTVEFVTDQVKSVRDAEGALVDGDPDRIETLTDIWLFARDIRSSDPNWQLVATRDPEERI